MAKSRYYEAPHDALFSSFLFCFISGQNILLNTFHLEVSLRAMLPKRLSMEHFFSLKVLRPIAFRQALLKIKWGEKCSL